jgi:hypothetical protein
MGLKPDGDLKKQNLSPIEIRRDQISIDLTLKQGFGFFSLLDHLPLLLFQNISHSAVFVCGSGLTDARISVEKAAWLSDLTTVGYRKIGAGFSAISWTNDTCFNLFALMGSGMLVLMSQGHGNIYIFIFLFGIGFGSTVP